MIKGFSEYINEQYANPKDLPMLKYGNPQKEHMDKMNKGSDLYSSVKDTDLWKNWTNNIPPLQSSDEAKKSIEELILIGNSQTEEDLEFVKDAEYDMKSIFVKFLKLNGADSITEEDLKKISDQLDPITFHLKYIFNYPRPYQLAGALDLPLYPSQTTDACSPAYPSGHTIDSFVMAGLIGKKIPQLRNEVEKLAAKISRSRLQGGIHFGFDQEFGKQIADDILNLDILSI
jgi:acid phosphatase (class A)